MPDIKFDAAFHALTGNPPFPWQVALYARFVAGDIPLSCTLPTGLGKTSVIAVWLIALANGKAVPRRLVYVVNRRTVVDQTTDEVEKYRTRLAEAGIADLLRDLCAIPLPKEDTSPLALSTLRGQFADNREWSADPARPAVICGTVDMIGSRLLFAGYGIGFKSRPLHAGFLGQDVLLVHDEAHLEPAFQELLTEIVTEQQRCRDFRPLRIMELTATSRGGESFPNPAEKTENDADPGVQQRVKAVKRLHLHTADDKKLAEPIADLATKFADHPDRPAVLVFCRTVDDMGKVGDRLSKKWPVATLTGTMRGLERDRMANPRHEDGSPVFARFLPPVRADVPEAERWVVTPQPGPVFLVCTSAGEVGVNISADHLVCDLSTFDSMAQRFGRVNRFGRLDDTEVHVVVPSAWPADKDLKEIDRRRRLTLRLLERVNGDVSPNALGDLPAADRLAAFAPEPTILRPTDILFDSWALTTVRGKLPGRPPVGPYLHGLAEWEPPETHVGWRTEVGLLDTAELLAANKPADLLADYPVKPLELLRDRSDRVFEHLSRIAKRTDGRNPPLRVWVLDEDGDVTPEFLGQWVTALATLKREDREARLDGRTILLPPAAGGLTANGTLDGTVEHDSDRERDYDVADEWEGGGRRLRLRSDDDTFADRTKGFRAVRRIDFASSGDEEAGWSWHWFERPRGGDSDGSKAATREIGLGHHTYDVTRNARLIVDQFKASLPEEIKLAVVCAAELHDLGKSRSLFQRVLGNFDREKLLAKSGRPSGRVAEVYRHEFGSLLDAESRIPPGVDRDLVLHLIAAHHGRGRPHFPADEAFDPEPPAGADPAGVAAEVPRRYARLQRTYGRWGLAYLESLLRAADYAASASPSEFVEGPR